MGIKPKYTVKLLFSKCKTMKCRKQFNSWHRRMAKKLGVLAECLSIIDKNKQLIANKNKQLYIQHAESCMARCKTITEFRKQYPQYVWFINSNLKKYRHQFIKQKFSSPQLICKKILESILAEKCLYNNRTILNNRKELDIYFTKYKLACEYDSYYWHNNARSQKEDANKKAQCEKLKIYLINIKEPALNYYNTFNKLLDSIKDQIKQHLAYINKVTGKELTEQDVDLVCITQTDLLRECYGLNDIEYILNNCNSYAEVRKKYNKIWQYLRNHKMMSLLDPVKKRDHRHMSKDDYLRYIAKECSSYTSFLRHKTHSFARRRGYTPDIKQMLSSSSSPRGSADS